MSSFILRLICLASLATPAMAVQPTFPAQGDARVRFADYDPHNVVTIYGRIGVATLVMLDKGEEILNMMGGDTEAWGVLHIDAKNGFSIKPKATLPDANMQVITKSGNVYNIDLKLAGKGKPYYMTVWYRYPKQEANKRTAAAKSNQVKSWLKDGSPITNRHYTLQGASSIAPIDVWNDNRSTYFRFAANSTVPAVYIVGEDGKQKLVEFNGTPGDVLVVHAVSPQFVLRQGDLVTCVYNEAYDPVGVRPATNTDSPHVERNMKGAAQ